MNTKETKQNVSNAINEKARTIIRLIEELHKEIEDTYKPDIEGYNYVESKGFVPNYVKDVEDYEFHDLGKEKLKDLTNLNQIKNMLTTLSTIKSMLVSLSISSRIEYVTTNKPRHETIHDQVKRLIKSISYRETDEEYPNMRPLGSERISFGVCRFFDRYNNVDEAMTHLPCLHCLVCTKLSQATSTEVIEEMKGSVLNAKKPNFEKFYVTHAHKKLVCLATFELSKIKALRAKLGRINDEINDSIVRAIKTLGDLSNEIPDETARYSSYNEGSLLELWRSCAYQDKREIYEFYSLRTLDIDRLIRRDFARFVTEVEDRFNTKLDALRDMGNDDTVDQETLYDVKYEFNRKHAKIVKLDAPDSTDKYIEALSSLFQLVGKKISLT